jgi:glycosyltransferase involved in cell wall biosynthesis
LPVAEALLAGCRVVCSDIPAHREVGDGHCRFVALQRNAEDALLEAIACTLQDPVKAPISLPQFSASRLAKQYISLYRRLGAPAAFLQNSRFPTSLPAAASEGQSR